jgi:hypothetical protein
MDEFINKTKNDCRTLTEDEWQQLNDDLVSSYDEAIKRAFKSNDASFYKEIA